MKRFQRIFLSLLAIFAVGFSMANAYTFEVRNRSPFGILNLKTLNLKPDTTHTGIILDGANYVIKIDPNHESTGAIRVDAICDESGVNCKKVSELGLGGGSSITIKGDPDNFCYRQDETTLVCNNTALRELIESWGLGGSIKIDGKDGAYCYRKKEDNVLICDNSSLPSGGGNANNPKITIYQGGVEKGSFTLNQSSNTGIYLDAGGSGNANNPKITIYQGGVEKGSFTLNQASNKTINLDAGGSGNANNPKITIYQGGVEKGSFTLNQASDKTIQLDAGGSGNANNPKITIYQGGVEKGNFTLNQVSDKNINLTDADTWKPNIRGQDGYVSGTTMSTVGLCWKTDTNGNPGRRSCGAGGGDSLWEEGTNTNGTRFSYITPVTSTNNIYLKSSIYYDSALEFWGLKSDGSNRTRQLKLDTKGIRIGESTTTYGYTGVGIGVLGAIGIGTFSDCSSNHLTMFASGSTYTGNFEILGNSRLLIGTNNDSYIYFNLGKKIGVNTTATNSSSTLTVNGGIKVGNCNTSGTGCNQQNAGEIRYVEPDGASKGYFIGCVKDTSVSNGYRRRILDSSNMSNTNFSNDSSCNDGVPYSLNNYQSLGIARPGQCSQ